MPHTSASSGSDWDDPRVQELWDSANVDLSAMSAIIESHFHSPCLSQVQIGGGGYARVFLHKLETQIQVVARLVLPVNDKIKTEAEVATMDSLRARTSIPVPKVHLFCSTANNPVHAEWILMDYLPGRPFCQTWATLTWEQKKTTAQDIAKVMAETFSLTATACGSMIEDCSLHDDQRALRYIADSGVAPQSFYRTVTSETPSGAFVLGPVNDVVFLDADIGLVPPSSRGPFATEREYMEAMAFRGIPGTRSQGRSEQWAYERALELYDVVRPFYRDLDDAPDTFAPAPLFHFAHNDFSAHNILIDPSTGHVTGVLDWEMSGFCPSWVAASPAAWFNDDNRRFILKGRQTAPEGFGDEPAEAAEVREYFRSELCRLDPSLFANYWRGVEPRAIYYNVSEPFPGNVIGWMNEYERYGWDSQRVPFPFDFEGWLRDLDALRTSTQDASSSAA